MCTHQVVTGFHISLCALFVIAISSALPRLCHTNTVQFRSVRKLVVKAIIHDLACSIITTATLRQAQTHSDHLQCSTPFLACRSVLQTCCSAYATCVHRHDLPGSDGCSMSNGRRCVRDWEYRLGRIRRCTSFDLSTKMLTLPA